MEVNLSYWSSPDEKNVSSMSLWISVICSFIDLFVVFILWPPVKI